MKGYVRLGLAFVIVIVGGVIIGFLIKNLF
jgi:hypothetical protein